MTMTVLLGPGAATGRRMAAAMGILGFFTAWPVNAWLIRIGIKEEM